MTSGPVCRASLTYSRRSTTPRPARSARARAGASPLAQGDNIAQLLLQLHLKHVEMADDMARAYRRLHFATAATLSRTLLDGGVTLMWAVANGDEAEAGHDQLLRVLAKGYQEQARQTAKGRAPPLTPVEQRVVSEAASRGLAELPDVASRLRDVDAVWAALGSGSVASDHYPHFGLRARDIVCEGFGNVV